MNSRLRGVTLVEVVIVVVIMAVLAVAVIPQFSTSTDTLGSTAEYNLSNLRSVIETYKGQHGGLPIHDGTAKKLAGLSVKTLANGTPDAGGPYGPYLPEMPENPFTGNTTVEATDKTSLSAEDVTPSNVGGWLYNPNTGHIFLDSDPGFDF